MPPFLLGDSYGDARMGIPRLFGLCFAFLFASSVSAAVTIDLGPSDYRNWGTGPASHGPNGIISSHGQTVRMPPAGGRLTVTRNPIIPYGSIANAAKNFTRVNPASIAASAAITALFLGLDWVFDEQLDSWMREGEYELLPPDPNAYHWADLSISSEIFSDPETACNSLLPYTSDTGWYHGFSGSMTVRSATAVACNGPRQGPGQPAPTGNYANAVVNRFGNQCPQGSFYDTDLRGCVVTGGLVPLGSSDWANLEASLPSANPNTVSGAAGDAMKRQGAPLDGFSDTPITGPSSVSGSDTTSTSTDPVTGDTIVTNTSTTTNISYGDTTITTSDTTTATTYQNGQQTSTTVTTETPSELPVDGDGGLPPAGEWPGFCDWATVVCDWLNWTQEEPPPDVDLPQLIDDDFFNEKTISFGAKSCPPDHEINLAPFLETTVGVSFQPLCDFAGLIYYMVMAASYIIAAYISIGVARNG